MAALAATAAVGTAAAALPAAAGPTVRPALSTDQTGAGHARTASVTLPTGDKVIVGTDPQGRVRTAHPASTARRTYLTQRYGDDTYVVPATALHALGAGSYRLAQFDVSALVAGRPGVAPGSGTAHPDFPMRTATIKVTDPQGRPADDASLSVVNVDDSRKYAAFPEALHGEARISVPDGHYALMAYYYTADDQGELTGEWLSFGQFTVSGTATTTAVDLRRATHEVSVATPKPAEVQGIDLTWARGASDDYGLQSGVSTYAGHPVRLSTSPAGVGVQHFSVHETATSPDSAATPYLYDVIFPSDRAIGANQHYRATAGSLATLNTSYYADEKRTGDSVWFDSPSWELFQFRLGIPLPQPMRRTEYLTGGAELTYSAMMDAEMSDEAFGGTFQSGSYVFRGGQHERVDWLRGPLAPTIPADTGVGGYFCGACRIDDTLSIALAPVGDSTPDHSGYLDDPSTPGTVSTSRFQLFSGSTQLADGKDVTGVDVAVPAARGNYRISYDQTRKAPWTAQSTSSHSEWTFSSAHSGRTTVPTDRWGCGSDGDPTHCSPVSLLLPHYRLKQGLDGRIPVGRNTLALTVDHSAGAPRVPVESATVSVSFDDGRTWTRAKVSDLGAGNFRAHWRNPAAAAGHQVTLKVTASDSTHATVTQIVHAAATVAQS
ncbi:hypothetical protein Athai_59130 [Actinocatenispora thailandica]|uniref:Uncharacterized protein n=1 Tax=Actinocatenispora thailandica TaxID=227318 RepID=A0A7R7DV41_9ACTN|nr:hypothetical protein Athai_59130 [Actinocatenispora thailandica]